MMNRASPSLIGGFVVGACVLAVAAILLFSSGRWFEKRVTYVLYFEDSLKGLTVGAPVTFRGTRVGTVKDIHVTIDAQQKTIRTPVYIELEEGSVHVVNLPPDRGTTGPDGGQDQDFIKDMIERQGLRAQLQMQSLVTGQLLVQLDFFPDTPVILHPEFHESVPEFPTIRSSLGEFTEKLESIPLEDMVNVTLHAIQSIDRIVSAPELLESMKTLNLAMKNVQALTKKLDVRVDSLGNSFEETSLAARKALNQVERTLSLESGTPGEIAKTWQRTVEEARKTFVQAQRSLSSLEAMAGDDSVLRYRLEETLQEMSAAARSIRVMADYLEEHPQALLHGKP